MHRLRRTMAVLLVCAFSVAPAAQKFDTSIKSTLAVGDLIPPIAAVGLDGKSVNIEFVEGKPTVLYVIAPDSALCIFNEPAFASLIVSAGDRFRWVILSTRDQGLADYIGQKSRAWGNVKPMVVGGITMETKQRLYLGGTPQTIVVERGGRVIQYFGGTYRDGTKTAVSRYFGVTLPDLNDP